MDKDSLQVWLIFLGAFLAFVASVAVELYKDHRNKRELNKNSKIVLRLEFNNAIGLVRTLIESYSAKGFFEFRVLNQLYPSITRLDQVRNAVVNFESDQKKEQILKLLNDLFLFHSDANSLEQIALPKKDGEAQGDANQALSREFIKDQRQMIALRSVDLIRRGEEIINYLSN